MTERDSLYTPVARRGKGRVGDVEKADAARRARALSYEGQSKKGWCTLRKIAWYIIYVAETFTPSISSGDINSLTKALSRRRSDLIDARKSPWRGIEHSAQVKVPPGKIPDDPQKRTYRLGGPKKQWICSSDFSQEIAVSFILRKHKPVFWNEKNETWDDTKIRWKDGVLRMMNAR